MRRGLSLLEVLISIFILTFGLLGILALLPVATHTVRDTATMDRSGACGRAALRDLQIRNFLDVRTWRTRGWLPVLSGDPADPVVPFGRSYAIDPLCLAAGHNHPGVETFPFDPDPTVAGDEPALAMLRINVAAGLQVDPAAPNANTVIRAAMGRIFVSQDDLSFSDERDGRPQRIPDPIPLTRDSIAGDYSWLLTVCHEPDGYDIQSAPGVRWSRASLLPRPLVSVVVFQKRDLVYPPGRATLPSERAVRINFHGPVDAVLSSDRGAAWIDTRKDAWLLVCGQDTVIATDNTGAVIDTWIGDRFRWFRVIHAGESDAPPVNGWWQRPVTLDGPEWPESWCRGGDLDGDGNAAETQAALFTGVVGVYHRH